ncbi:Phosphocholine transferase AnkX [Wolbachia endosymbiont of Armadillidium vulgare]|nr:Phosphocholine transferase AnkX [Armadillidium vulgare] [Wolbachia endosymbiont of Armadillidium vulgare]OJH30578.1 Phosphocholine transferase AnkX [Armadillidium vulgare] [Wolbachia endosymbiont of Armadillidium vulgare]OJH31373.1 Phosphocholine transferase AnkX [Wolbachia endosymbiont of Armadillidium vulgare]OJH32315.1 Phosphocholine transferase AnkX [Wolbachia endosymbiont of Armadillidium vulgare]
MSKKEKEKSVKELLENSFKSVYERDEKGRTVLHYAVEAKTVRLLVEKGVDVNAADVGGYTALHLAVTEKRLEIVRELIKSGADVNVEEYDSKCTPLHLACMMGKVEIVKELVEAGGEIEQEDKYGMTAIDYAKNSKEITEVLENKTREMEKLLEKLSKLSKRTVDAIFNLKLEEKGERRSEEIRKKLDKDPLVQEAVMEVEKELRNVKKKIKGL